MDPEQPIPSPDATPPAQPPTTADGASPAGTTEGEATRTVEEVEAAWRNRLAQHGRASKAAEEALRTEIETLQRQLAASGPSAQPQAGPEAQRLREVEAELERERGLRVVEQRKVKYPALAIAGIDDSFIAAGDDAGLARLNALLDQSGSGGGTFIAPTAPKRATPTAPKADRDKSKEELLDDLKRVAPAYTAWQREQSGRG